MAIRHTVLGTTATGLSTVDEDTPEDGSADLPANSGQADAKGGSAVLEGPPPRDTRQLDAAIRDRILQGYTPTASTRSQPAPGQGAGAGAGRNESSPKAATAGGQSSAAATSQSQETAVAGTVLNQDVQAVVKKMEQLVKEKLPAINDMSKQENIEYGALIYLQPDGSVHITNPTTQARGAEWQITDADEKQIPQGAVEIGVLHTHGDYSRKLPNGKIQRVQRQSDDQFNSNRFSTGKTKGRIDPGYDIGTGRVRGSDEAGRNWKPFYRAFLGTPSGKILEYNPNKDNPDKPFNEAQCITTLYQSRSYQ